MMVTGKMKACIYTRTGAASDVLEIARIDTPTPRANEVLVRLAFSGLNPTDVKRRSGARGKPPFDLIVPHFDGAGVVEAIGEGVDPQMLGQRAWVWEGQLRRPYGTAAEYIAIDQARVMPLPDTVSFKAGAALGVPAMTAARALSLGGDLDGRSVVVSGGAGMVGNAAIRLAKRVGAFVVTTVSSAEKAELATAAGADVVINYQEQPVTQAILDAVGGEGAHHLVDVDLAAHLPDAWQYLKAGSSIASYGTQSAPEPVFPFAKYMYKNISVHGVAVFDIPEAAKKALADQ